MPKKGQTMATEVSRANKKLGLAAFFKVVGIQKETGVAALEELIKEEEQKLLETHALMKELHLKRAVLLLRVECWAAFEPDARQLEGWVAEANHYLERLDSLRNELLEIRARLGWYERMLEEVEALPA